MHALRVTPSIEVSIGRETRLYHAFITTAPITVDATELDWQRARCREGRHLFAPADPVLVGLNTLEHWLWNRIGSSTADLVVAHV